MGKWKEIIGQNFTPGRFKEYVAGLSWDEWQPEFIVLHHTAVPSLSQRPMGFTHEHILGLEKYYRDEIGWSAGPHLFVDDHVIWVFTPLTVPGVHAKSFNGRSIGLEMLGNYDVEAFNSGRGLAVQQNAVAAIAILSAALDIDPDSMMCHRDEPNTTKTCPGNKVNKADFIQAVKDYLAGEAFPGRVDTVPNPFSPPTEPPKPQGAFTMNYRVKPNTLNIRSGPGTNYEDLGDINAGQIVAPVDAAGWLPVLLEDNTIGWLCLDYLEPVTGDPGPVGESVDSSQPAPPPGKMKTSQSGLEFIKNEEGCVLHVYNDPAGYPTIGVGHLIKPGEEFTTLTESEALDLLAQDLKVAEAAVNQGVKVPLNQNQFDALVSFAFNVGTGALAKSTLLKLLNQGQYDAVPEQLMRWVKAGGQTLPGLVKRRQREGELWDS